MEFEDIYQRYFRDVYRFTFSLAQEEALAEEIAQETFFKALKAIDRFDGSKDIRAWLFTIARNTFYSHCRARKRTVTREELRKMRTPISVPPDEDKDAVKRFREFRAQVRRKKNVRTICVASVLALIAAFCLWYTWPRSWTRVAGTDPVGGLSAILTTYRFNFEDDRFEEKLGWNIWGLDDEDADADVTAALVNALNSHTYRSSLSNLLNNTPFGRDGYSSSGNIAGFVKLSLYIQDRQEWILLSLWDNGDVIYNAYGTDGRSADILYRTDPALYEELAEIVQEYGTLED